GPLSNGCWAGRHGADGDEDECREPLRLRDWKRDPPAQLRQLGGGLRPLPNLPPQTDCAGEAGARNGRPITHPALEAACRSDRLLGNSEGAEPRRDGSEDVPASVRVRSAVGVTE